jgi:hypothetical protein
VGSQTLAVPQPLAFAFPVVIARKEFAVVLALVLERDFSPCSSPPRSGHRSADGGKPKGEAAESIAFVLLFAFFFHFQPKNRM